jgi:hypothetical protein
MTTYKGLGISIKYGNHSRKMEVRVNQHALGVRVLELPGIRNRQERLDQPRKLV